MNGSDGLLSWDQVMGSGGNAAPVMDAAGAPILLSDITGKSADAYPVMAKPGVVQSKLTLS